MRVVIISDLHVKNPVQRGHYIDGIHESIYWPLYNLRLAAEKAKENDAILIIAGDVNDSKRFVSQQVIYETIQTLEEVGNIVDTYLILGNHDYELYNNKIYSYLLNLVNVNVVLPNDPLTIDGEIGLVSYNYNRENLLQDFVKIGYNELKLIVSHFGLREGKLSGTEYRTGEFSLRDILLNDNQLLILGHYHLPQQVAKNVYYVGSAIPTRLNEIQEDKRMLLVDTDTLEVKSIHTVYPKYKIIDLNGSNKTFNIDSIIEVINKDPIMNKFIINVDKNDPKLQYYKDAFEQYKENVILRVVNFNKQQSSNSIKDISIEKINKDEINKMIINKYIETISRSEEDIEEYKDIFDMHLGMEV